MLQVIVDVVRFDLPFLYDSPLTELIGRDGDGKIRCVNEGIGHSFWYSQCQQSFQIANFISAQQTSHVNGLLQKRGTLARQHCRWLAGTHHLIVFSSFKAINDTFGNIVHRRITL